MVITVASGKGGTGKTTIAVNLAAALSRPDTVNPSREVWLADCDVEAPNDALFLKPKIDSTLSVKWMIPEVDMQKCNLCGRCAEVCAYHAIAITGNRPIIFKDLCHACGSCTAQCPTGAISEHPEEIGTIQVGAAEKLNFIQGTLIIGYSSPTPIIREMKTWLTHQKTDGALIIRDASPGTSCPVVECLRGSDFALLVTEPTPFGLHDLKLITELALDEFHLPAGVVINKSDGEDKLITDFCAEKQLPVLLRIPLSRKIAEIYSQGQLLIDARPETQISFAQMMMKIEELVLPSKGEA